MAAFRKLAAAVSPSIRFHLPAAFTPQKGKFGSSLLRFLTHLSTKTASSPRSLMNVEISTKEKESFSRFQAFIRDKCELGFDEIEDAFELFDQMLHRRWRYYSLSIVAYTQLFGAVAKMGHHSTVITLYKRMMAAVGIQPDLYTLTILISCLCQLNKVDSAFAVLGYIFRSGYQPNVVTLTSLINGLCLVNRVPKAMGLFRKAEKMDFPINEITYAAIINGFCKSGKVQTALELLKEMEDKQNCVPDVTVYSTIIDGLCKQGLVDNGLCLFSKMKRKGISPNIITYSCLVHGLYNQDRWTEADVYFSEMVLTGISPDVTTFNILIDAFCKRRMTAKVHEVLALMLRIGQEPDTFTYNSLICGYCLIGKMNVAVQVFNSMLEGQSVFEDYILFDGMFEIDCVGEAIKLFNLIETEGLQPDILTYSILIDGMVSVGEIKFAERLFNLIPHKGLQVGVITYNIMIKGYCKQGMLEEANQLFLQMEENGCVPDAITYKSLIRGFLQKNDGFKALRFINTMIERGVLLKESIICPKHA